MRLSKSPSKLRFECPQLKNLVILSSFDYCQNNVKEIELYAPNLVLLEVASCKEVDIIFGHVPQLQSVTLNIPAQEHVVPCVARKLLTEVPHLKSLSLVTTDYHIFEGRPRGTLPIEIINMVSNLRRLDLSVRFTREDTDLVSMTTPLLQCCPLLQDFHLNVLDRWEDPRPRGKKEATLFHSELKKVEISGFVGTKNDIEFALYILKSAPSLEEMYISRCSKIYDNVCWCSKIYDNVRGPWRFPLSSTTPWSWKVLIMIKKQLKGQAISKTVRLIIQHNVRIEDHVG